MTVETVPDVELTPDIEQINLEEMVEYLENNDPSTRTHLVRPIENEHICKGVDLSAQDIVDTARLLGLEVVALCGYKWVPLHDPTKYPGCEPCFKVAALITAGLLP